MLRKVKFILFFISLSISLCLMSNTYSRYVSDTTGNIEMSFAKWQILVNTFDITANSESSIEFEPVLEENENIASNSFAPSSKGYFDIEIDPTNVDVSFRYKIKLSIENENTPDIIIPKYAILPENYIEGDLLTYIDITENEINSDVLYDNATENFKFDIINIRVYFEWFEGEGELMDDQADTEIGLNAEKENTKLMIKSEINFEQIIE